MKICSVEGCAKRTKARGWCQNHYQRWRLTGSPAGLGLTKRGAPLEWALQHISFKGDDCLEWPFSKATTGYGQININGRVWRVHRLMCLLANGEPPSKEHEVAHACCNRACCNPQHLRWATRKENAMDRIVHGTHCRGERSRHAKLNENQVRTIRALTGAVSQRDLAARYGVSQTEISRIQRKVNWHWLGAEDEIVA